MAININHTNNTFCGNSGIFVFGTGITGDSADTVFSQNFCGNYHGDGSQLTGLPTASLLDDSWSFLLNPSVGFVNSGCFNFAINTTFSSICEGANNNFISPSAYSTICSGAYQSAIIGGVYNTINTDVSRSVILGGSSITASNNDTAYAANFCAANGSYYGDGSGLTNLATGCFVTTGQTGCFVTSGQTGDFIINPNDFRKSSNNYNFNDGGNNKTSGSYNFIVGNYHNISGCYAAVFGGSNTIEHMANTNFVASYNSKISGLACNNAVIGGVSNTIAQYTFASAIIGGMNIVASCNYTVYGQNFCAFGGKYYGDGSALTGITGLGGGSSTPQQTTTLLTGSTGFFHTSKNIGILAQNCFTGEAFSSGYLVLNKGNANETCDLFTVCPTTYCVGTFSAMLIGNGWNDGAVTTSMRIDGVYGNGQVLNQVKNIYYRTDASNDASVYIENDSFRIAVSGVSGTMAWSSKIDILDMLGYD